MGEYRNYTDEEKAVALATIDANGGNVAQTSRDLGIPDSTLRRWSNGEGYSPAVPEIGERKKGDLADAIERVAHTLVGAMEGKIADASLQQVATSLGISVDKMRLLRGESTAITEDRTDARERLSHLVAGIIRTEPDSNRVKSTNGHRSREPAL